jgi:hypothetical protein
MQTAVPGSSHALACHWAEHTVAAVVPTLNHNNHNDLWDRVANGLEPYPFPA